MVILQFIDNFLVKIWQIDFKIAITPKQNSRISTSIFISSLFIRQNEFEKTKFYASLEIKKLQAKKKISKKEFLLYTFHTFI